MAYFLAKTDPQTYSIDDLKRKIAINRVALDLNDANRT